MDSNTVGKSTLAVWGGEGFEQQYIATPVVRSVAFAYDDVQQCTDSGLVRTDDGEALAGVRVMVPFRYR